MFPIRSSKSSHKFERRKFDTQSIHKDYLREKSPLYQSVTYDHLFGKGEVDSSILSGSTILIFWRALENSFAHPGLISFGP
jgi:hypothetical protein